MKAWFLSIVMSVVVILVVSGFLAWREVLWREGWFRGPPPIASGMMAFAGTDSGPWSRRLVEEFPIGSSETDMIAKLQKQGFQINVATHRAGYGWAVYPCVYTLTVDWQSDELKRVRGIRGGLLNGCTDPRYLLPQRRPAGELSPTPPPSTAQPDPSLVPPGQSA